MREITDCRVPIRSASAFCVKLAFVRRLYTWRAMSALKDSSATAFASSGLAASFARITSPKFRLRFLVMSQLPIHCKSLAITVNELFRSDREFDLYIRDG